MLADRVKEISASTTMLIAAEAKKLKKQGVDIIDLSVGEPDFNTPQNIKSAGNDAINDNITKYTFNQGTIELRDAIALKLKRDNNLDYNANEIIVSNGAKQGVYNSIFALVNPGDEVIIPAPYWVSYPSMVVLAGGKPVILDTDEKNGFKIDPEILKYHITPKTRLLILCNPSNPSGTVYKKKELEQLAEIALANKIYVISDEIYEKMTYSESPFTSFASISTEVKKHSLIINGVSKSYSMTGWRIGYACGPESVINAMNKIQSHTTSHASSISQQSAIEALTGPQDEVIKMVTEFRNRRDIFYNELIKVNGISCFRPEGSFYLFPNVSKYFNTISGILKIQHSFDFAMHLLYHAHIAAVPGSAFGKEGYLRLSYTTSIDNLIEAVSRFKEAVKNIS